MITTTFKVKFISGNQDGVSQVQPDQDDDETKGYSVGFNLLVKDGTSWICADATEGAAVWDVDPAYNDSIIAEIRKLTELIPLYCNQHWPDVRYRMYVQGVEFSAAGTIDKVGANFDDSFFTDDTLWIEGSRRNDGPYNVALATADQVICDPLFPFEYVETENILLYAAVYPIGLQDIAARMAWYDVYVRPGRNPGLDSESIGTYSYSKTAAIGGIEYPVDITAGMTVYRRPKVM